MKAVKLTNITKVKGLPHTQHGQAMTEYIIVCVFMAMVLIIPFEGKQLYVLVVDALRLMHKGYSAGLSVYAYPF